MKLTPCHLGASIDLEVIVRPRPGLELKEAMDLWLSLNPAHRIMDYGDNQGREMLVAVEQNQIVEYRMEKECCPPGATLEQLADHMRAAGYDVRGTNSRRQTVIVCERKV